MAAHEAGINSFWIGAKRVGTDGDVFAWDDESTWEFSNFLTGEVSLR